MTDLHLGSMAAKRDAVGGARAGDAHASAALVRVKWLANAVLAGCLALLVLARALQTRHPAFGFVAAFAEAATIGGLADWYAVVALFRRPLGLPIPHTAIIAANRQRIAEKLGEFVEEHFLAALPVEAKLRQTDFASFMSEWLVDEKRSADFARFALRLLPEVVAAAEASGVAALVSRQVRARLETTNLAPLAAATLRRFVAAGRHRALIDELISAFDAALNRPETLNALRAKIRSELPTLLNLYRADAFLQKRIAASARSFFAEVHEDAAHPVRGELDRLVLSFVERLETDPAYAARLDGLKNDVLASPELGALSEKMWASLKVAVETQAETAALEPRLAALFRAAGAQLALDREMRAEVNQGVVAVASGFIAEHKSGVSTFIADQVRAWDLNHMIAVIETNIGKDLQYIRFNGALIGGLAGLALYAGEWLLRMS